MTKDRPLPAGITKRVYKRKRPDGSTKTYKPMYRVRATWTRPASEGSGDFVTSREEVGEFDTLTDAKAALTAAQADIARGVFVPPAEMRRRAKAARLAAEQVAADDAVTVAVWAEQWLHIKETEEPRLATSTLMSYRSTLRAHVLPALGDIPVRAVTTEQIDAVIAAAGAGSKAGAARNVARALRAMFNVAVERQVGGLSVSPVKVKNSMTAAPQRADEEIPNLAQVRALIAAAPEDVRLGIQLGAACGLRLGEMLGLQRRDFQDLDKPGLATVSVRRQWLSKGTVYAAPKYGSKRRLPLPDHVVPAVLAHLDRYVLAADDAPVIISTIDNARCMSHKAFAARWDLTNTAAQVEETKAKRPMPRFTFHALRHFALTEYGKTGATLEDLRRHAGHKDLATVARYQHSNLERSRQLAAQLPNLTASDGEKGTQ